MATDSRFPGVDAIRARYPKEMTIVLQEWFADLAVMNDRFSVTLNFGDVPESIVVPFIAVRTFVAPSVEVGFRFEEHEDIDGGSDDGGHPGPPTPPPQQPKTMSGYSPAIAICFFASSPITVWCSITWFSTEPSA